MTLWLNLGAPLSRNASPIWIGDFNSVGNTIASEPDLHLETSYLTEPRPDQKAEAAQAAGADHASQASSSEPPVERPSSDVAYEVLDPDVRLMLMVRDGNAAAFEELVRRYQDRVLGVLQNIVSDREHAEDLAQEVFLRVYRARERYTPDAKFSTWLFTITHNVARNAIRQLSRRREVSTAQRSSGSDSSPALSLEQMAKAKSGLMPARQLDQLEIGEVVRQAMELLPERQRMALLLAKFEEMSYQDIGDTMGLTVQAVKSLLSRARNNLKDHLTPYLDAGRLPNNYGEKENDE